MVNLDDLVKQASDLLKQGAELQLGNLKSKDLGKLNLDYQSWYTRALAVVKLLTPERALDFQEAYKVEKRKEINYATYAISDYLMNLVVKRGGVPIFDTEQAFTARLLKQLGILAAAIEAAPSALYNLRTLVRAEFMDSDIASAKELVKAGHLRAAGVVCGVVLENHLRMVAEQHQIVFRKKNIVISDANDALKEKLVFDVPMWRLIQRLADIRNLCAHSKDREPRPDEVDDLIVGTEKVIKEVF